MNTNYSEAGLYHNEGINAYLTYLQQNDISGVGSGDFVAVMNEWLYDYVNSQNNFENEEQKNAYLVQFGKNALIGVKSVDLNEFDYWRSFIGSSFMSSYQSQQYFDQLVTVFENGASPSDTIEEINSLKSLALNSVPNEEHGIVESVFSVGVSSIELWSSDFSNTWITQITGNPPPAGFDFDWGSVGAQDVGGAVGGAIGGAIGGGGAGALPGAVGGGGAVGASAADAVAQWVESW